MAVIAISQQIGSRGIELGELTARELGYRFQTGEQLIAETAKRFNVNAEQMKWFDVHSPHFWERKTDTGRFAAYYRRLSCKRPRKTASSSPPRLVAFSAGRRMRIRVRTMAPVPFASSRSPTKKSSRRQRPTSAFVTSNRSEGAHSNASARHRRSAIYDLVINTSRLPLASLANTLARWRLISTAKAARANEMHARRRDRCASARGAGGASEIGDTQMSVNCSAGCVRVSGVGLVPPWDDLVIGVAQKIEGVASVEVGADDDPVT